MSMAVSISAVIPMYNEEGYIRRTVKEVVNALKDITDDYEIIIVDDASTDNSGRIADELSQEDPHIRVARHKKNRKLGASLRTGFNLASKELVLYTDMDMPFDLKEIRKAVDLVVNEKADFVSAYRLGTMGRGDGIKRYIYSIVYNLFIRYIFGLRIRDVNFSFKLIWLALLKELNLRSEGSFIDAEMLIKAQRRGAKIVQFGTKYFPRLEGMSGLSNLSIIIKILQEALAFRRQLF